MIIHLDLAVILNLQMAGFSASGSHEHAIESRRNRDVHGHIIRVNPNLASNQNGRPDRRLQPRTQGHRDQFVEMHSGLSAGQNFPARGIRYGSRNSEN